MRRSRRAVLDAGVVASALLRPDGPPGRLLRMAVKQRAFDLVLSESILRELTETLLTLQEEGELELSALAIERWTAALAILAILVQDRTEVPQLGQAPGDDKYLAAALAAEAVIVSSDPKLLATRSDGEIEVVSPQVFLEVLEIASEELGGSTE